ncbi:MAG: hypothetical protein H8K03_22680 (plasmid) [Nitrospira sp.]
MSERGFSLIIRPNPLAAFQKNGQFLVSQGHGWARQDLRGTMDLGPRAAREWLQENILEFQPTKKHA